MCTTIASKHPTSGSAKGAPDWFAVDHVYLAYDHPAKVADEHAVLLDFVNEASGPGARVAVELSLESASELAAQLLKVIEQANAYEGAEQPAPAAPPSATGT